MAELIKDIERRFVMVTYDVPVATHKRGDFRLLLKMAGLRMLTESQYYGPFNIELYEEIKKIVAQHPGIQCNLLLPNYDFGDDAKLLRENYETEFIKDFMTVKQKLLFAEKALSGEEVHVDKDSGKTRPFKGREIIQRIQTAEHILEILQTSLAKRKVREPDKNFEEMEAEIRHLTSYASHLTTSAIAYKNRGVNKALAFDAKGAE